MRMDGLILLLGLVLVYLLVFPLVAFISARKSKARLDEIETKLVRLAGLLADVQDRLTEPDSLRQATQVTAVKEARGTQAQDDTVSGAPVPEDMVIAAPAQEGGMVAVEDQSEEPGPPPPPAEPADESALRPAAAEAGPWAASAARRAEDERPARPGIEETLASKGMIWLGAVAVGLSAVFLFRYAIDEGWLTPMARVLAGLVLGGLLLSAGEWTERRPVPQLGRAMSPDYVPPALTASGVFAIYAALYAAHGLYGLMGPATAFVALGLVAYAALGLALRQGWFVALMGLAGGYLMPALIFSPDPQAVPLFLYLWVLSAGCLALMVWRHWWWFAALTLGGALLWPLLWFGDAWTIADQGVLGCYGVGLAALFAGLSTHLPVKQPQTPLWRWMSAMLADTSGLGFTLCGVLLLLLADLCDFNTAAFFFLAAYGALAMAMAVWRKALESLAVAAALIVLAAFLLWPQPVEVSLPERVQELGTASAGTAFGPFVMPPEFHVFSRALWAFAALFGLGGFLALPQGRTAAVWAGLSAGMPVLLFAIGYWRIGAFEVDINWALVGVGLAALLLLAAASFARRPEDDRRDVALALYAAGCTAAIALAFACVLREAWLSVALAAEVLALAWIWDRLRVAELRAIAVVMAGVVLVRLVANPAILDYQGGIAGLFGWVIYGYGLPAAALIGAARLFSRTEMGRHDPLVILCEILGLGFGFLMVAFQLKLWTSGTIRPANWDLFDSAVQVLWWITAAALCLRRSATAQRPWLRYAGGAVLMAAGLVVGLGHGLSLNPLYNRALVGTWPLVNLLGLAYLLPAISFGWLGSRPGFDLGASARKALRGGAGVLLFVYVTLETRRAFQGSDIFLVGIAPAGDAEIYAYSLVWILFALILLALGVWRGSQSMRYASLAVLIVTVVKVFLYDMSDLTGLFRVASFLGLGLTLIGIARVYRRYVFQPGAAEDQTGK